MDLNKWTFVLTSCNSHPDKVKITGNQTAESVAAKFVEITKAYKSCALAFVLPQSRPDLSLPIQVDR
jgi:hypothetical protein